MYSFVEFDPEPLIASSNPSEVNSYLYKRSFLRSQWVHSFHPTGFPLRKLFCFDLLVCYLQDEYSNVLIRNTCQNEGYKVISRYLVPRHRTPRRRASPDPKSARLLLTREREADHHSHPPHSNCCFIHVLYSLKAEAVIQKKIHHLILKIYAKHPSMDN